MKQVWSKARKGLVGWIMVILGLVSAIICMVVLPKNDMMTIFLLPTLMSVAMIGAIILAVKYCRNSRVLVKGILTAFSINTVILALSVWWACVDESNGDVFYPIPIGIAYLSMMPWVVLFILALLSPICWGWSNSKNSKEKAQIDP
jgi:hypothetical protein